MGASTKPDFGTRFEYGTVGMCDEDGVNECAGCGFQIDDEACACVLVPEGGGVLTGDGGVSDEDVGGSDVAAKY